MDERHPSLALDNGVGVAAPQGGGWGGGRRRLAAVGRLSWRRRCMNGEMEGGGISNFGTRFSEMWVTNLSPV